MKDKDKQQDNKISITKLILYLWILLMGFLLGAMCVYKIEVNTVNKAFESLRYCYETYGGF